MPPLPSSAPRRYRPGDERRGSRHFRVPYPSGQRDIRVTMGRVTPLTREDAVRLDEADPLGSLRERFLLPDGVIYLLGNSLGALPREAPAAFERVVREEWGGQLIDGWNAGW